MDEKKQEKLPTLDEYLEWYYGVKPVHKEITPELFERYRKRYSPCGSLASLYLWEIAGGAIPGMTDRAPKTAGKRGAAAR